TKYIKRAVGMPGDLFESREKVLMSNSERAEELEPVMEHYRVETRERIRLSAAKVRQAGGLIRPSGNNAYSLNMTAEVAEAIAQWGEIESVEPFVVPEDFDTFSRRGFNFSRGFMNHDHMPAFTIPYEGQVVELSAENWHLYQDIVERYERNSVQ